MKHRLGTLEIDATFTLTRPWTILFGCSGSGKSTILRAIAGLLQPDRAKIVIHWKNQALVAVDTDAGILLRPHKRPIRWAAQRPALFPHMTVRENLSFASEVKHAGGEEAIALAMQSFRLGHLASRRGSFLSGGEQQRISIARAAIAANGRLLLLDEPFSGLDTPLRDELLADLQIWAAESGTPILSVTHDISEAFQLNAEVLKLHNGRITAQGPAPTVLAQERTRLLAQLGGNL